MSKFFSFIKDNAIELCIAVFLTSFVIGFIISEKYITNKALKCTDYADKYINVETKWLPGYKQYKN